MTAKGGKRKTGYQRPQASAPREAPYRQAVNPAPVDPSDLEQLPSTYQAIHDYYRQFREVELFALRKEAIKRIERATGRPLVCYVTRTNNFSPVSVPIALDDSDLVGFRDLIHGVESGSIDVFIVSNGGSAEAAERIALLLRERFQSMRFIVPANAYSAATLLCFAGDEIVMGALGTLGPIDPQIAGIPARTILRAFENLEKRLKEEGPTALTAYVPLLEKYELHILEICKSAQGLSDELARNFLSRYMLQCDRGDPRIDEIIRHFSDYDSQKSHSRGIGRQVARDKGLNVTFAESVDQLDSLIYSLYNQYEFFFDNSPFYKLFENSVGINWGRQKVALKVEPPTPRRHPEQAPAGPPARSD